MSLGKFPDLSLGDAKAKAQEYNSLLAKGIDPEEHRREEDRKQVLAKIQTFEAAFRRWLEINEHSIADSYRMCMLDAMEPTSCRGLARSHSQPHGAPGHRVPPAPFQKGQL